MPVRSKAWATPPLGGTAPFDCALDKHYDLFYFVSMQTRRNGSHDSLGEFEALVLMAVLRLGRDAYGMRIHDELENRAKRSCSYGALYTTLDRLEQKGYVSSSIGEPTPERGGRAKKYFKVDNMGKAALRQSVQATQRMAEGMELLGGASW